MTFGSISLKSNGTFTEYVDIDYTIGDTIVNQRKIMKGTYEIKMEFRKNITSGLLSTILFMAGDICLLNLKLLLWEGFSLLISLREICIEELEMRIR